MQQEGLHRSAHDEEAEAFVQLDAGGGIVDGVVVADLEGEQEDAAPESDEDHHHDDGNLSDQPAGDQGEAAMQEDLADDSIHTFEGHTAGVYAVAWSPTSDDLVASGGGDDRAFLWRVGEDAYMETQGAVHELTGHTDTVSALAFSKDGKLLATGGMDGCVRVWTVDEGRCMTTLEGPGDAVEWVRWHPKGTVVLAGCADFTVWMWNAQTGACMQVFSGHSGPVTCGGFSADGKLVVTGGGEGDASLRIWDPKTGECKFTLQGGHFHAAGLTALAFHPDAAVVLTGSEDGTSKIVALDTGRVINTLTGHEEDASLEAVAFLPGLPLAATAGLDGKLIVWDVASATSRVVCQHPEGIVRMICHHSQPLILTGCIDGAVRVWDARTGACSHTFGGHVEAVQDMALSPNGTLVLSGSEDGTVRVFSLVDT